MMDAVALVLAVVVPGQRVERRDRERLAEIVIEAKVDRRLARTKTVATPVDVELPPYPQLGLFADGDDRTRAEAHPRPIKLVQLELQGSRPVNHQSEIVGSLVQPMAVLEPGGEPGVAIV